MLLHVLAHVDTHHGGLVVEEELGQGLGEFGLADAGRPKEEERSGGSVGVGDTCPGAPYRVGDAPNRTILADEALMDALLHVQQLLLLALHHASHRDAGPRRDDLGDVGARDLLGDHPGGLLLVLGSLGELLLQGWDLTVEDLGGLAEVSLPLVFLGSGAQ